MRLKIIALALLLSTMSSSVLAVDGYKNLKFGSSVETVLKSKLCTFEKYPSETPGLESYACEDFKFSGKNTLSMAVFLNGKFQRFAINLNTSVSSVLDGLTKKYGSASSSSTAEQIERAKTTGESIFIRFDNDTVYVQANKNLSTGKEEAILIYTWPLFEKELLAFQTKSLGKDL